MLATTLLATPAMARDKSLYLGVEAGPSWASDLDLDADIQGTERDFLEVDHKLGYDVGLIFGYDGGMVRAELDLSYKRWSHDEYDDGVTVIDGDGSTRYIAIMTNLLLDVGNEDGLSFYIGPGAGFAWGKFDVDDSAIGDDDDARDGGVAWQIVAGARYALSPNVDLGVKYRYFHPSRVKEGIDFDDDGDSDLDINGRMHSHSILATLTYNFYTPPP
ncbi:MAG TPA: outer membrane beta-barrel protein, partial [Sphingomicrobium sp.]|nr:outer membrane beta-barrel protein [Sphingomicrobium sp.]